MLLATVSPCLTPIEVKYCGSATNPENLKGIRQFCQQRGVERGYVITKDIFDFGVFPLADESLTLLKIPVPLACCWLGGQEDGNDANNKF